MEISVDLGEAKTSGVGSDKWGSIVSNEVQGARMELWDENFGCCGLQADLGSEMA
jgi:hypothetical protein